MVRAVVASTLVLAVCAAPAVADPVGRYAVSGKNPGNRRTYSGTASVDKTGDSCRDVRQIGSDRYVGTSVGNEEFMRAGAETVV